MAKSEWARTERLVNEGGQVARYLAGTGMHMFGVDGEWVIWAGGHRPAAVELRGYDEQTVWAALEKYSRGK